MTFTIRLHLSLSFHSFGIAWSFLVVVGFERYFIRYPTFPPLLWHDAVLVSYSRWTFCFVERCFGTGDSIQKFSQWDEQVIDSINASHIHPLYVHHSPPFDLRSFLWSHLLIFALA